MRNLTMGRKLFLAPLYVSVMLVNHPPPFSIEAIPRNVELQVKTPKNK